MPLTLNTAWKAEAKRSTVKPVDVLRVYTVDPDTGGPVQGSTLFSFCSDAHAGLAYPTSVKKVGMIAPKIGKLTRKFSVSDFRVTLRRDPFTRKLIKNTRLRNKIAELVIGWRGIVEGSYGLRARGIITNWDNDESEIELRIMDAGALIRKKKVRGFWVNLHPLEIIEKIFQLVGIPPALYDATTLGAAGAQLLPDAWKPLNFTRMNSVSSGLISSNGLTEAEDAWELCVDLASLLNGTLAPDQNGKYSFKQYNFNATPVKTLQRRDIESAVLDDAESDTANVWEMGIPSLFNSPRGSQEIIRRKDPNSITDHTVPGQASVSGEITKTVPNNPWLRGQGWSESAINALNSAAGEGTTFIVSGAGISGFAGCHFDTIPNLSAIPSWAQLSDTKLGYLLLVGNPTRNNKIAKEVISVKAASVVGAGIAWDDDQNQYMNLVQFTVKQRDVLDWHAGNPNWKDLVYIAKDNVHIFDVTAMLLTLKERLSRTALGSPDFKVKLHSYEHFDLTPGDLVYVVDDVPLYFAQDGQNGTKKLEVLGKRAQWPRIELLLGATEASAPATIETPIITPVLITEPTGDKAIYTHESGPTGTVQKVVTHPDGGYSSLETVIHY